MGCVVNGPGEAKEADLGVAGGIGEGLLIKHGQVVKKCRKKNYPGIKIRIRSLGASTVGVKQIG